MIDRDDLRASVAAGLLSEAQASSLIALADSRRGARENLDPGDEPFELFRGFNEIFIVIGLAILGSGWVGVVAWFIGDRILDLDRTIGITGAITAATIWLLSEYFIRIRRMIAPAIALSIMFAGAVAAGLSASLGEIFMVAQSDYSSLSLPLSLSILALLGFWMRFKVPFALAMIALGAFAVALLLAADRAGTPDNLRDIFLLSAGGPFAWITLVLGALVFAAAMAFDMSDPHRVTRRAANGFWLHVIAAPALVNTVALSLLASEGAWADTILLAVLGLFALIAIVIDRRSFLIAAIAYIVALSGTLFEGSSGAILIFLLGAVLLFLGAMWERIRGRLLSLLPGFIPRHRLPPASNARD